MTYQNDRKELNDLIEYLQRRDNLVESDLTIYFWNQSHRLKLRCETQFWDTKKLLKIKIMWRFKTFWPTYACTTPRRWCLRCRRPCINGACCYCVRWGSRNGLWAKWGSYNNKGRFNFAKNCQPRSEKLVRESMWESVSERIVQVRQLNRNTRESEPQIVS